MMKRTFLILLITIVLGNSINAQVSTNDDIVGRDAPNTITTTVPFLLIAPDSRAEP